MLEQLGDELQLVYGRDSLALLKQGRFRNNVPEKVTPSRTAWGSTRNGGHVIHGGSR